MSLASQSQHPLVVQHDRLVDFIEQRYAGWHAGVPILMGLTIITIAVAAILLSVSPTLALPVTLVMTILMLGAAILSIVSLVMAGEVIEARFDDQKQVVHLLYRGPTAHTEWQVPFSRISGARMALTYSPTGTKELTPTLELTDGGKINLPASTTWNDIDQIRAMVAQEAPEAAQVAWSKKDSARAASRNTRRPASK